MVHVCCVCHQVKGENGWSPASVPYDELASHGYCPTCAAIARFRLELMRFQRQYLSQAHIIDAA